LAEIVQLDFESLLPQECQGRIDVAAIESVLEQKVPLAFLFCPAETDRALRHLRPGFGGVPHEELPIAVLDSLISVEPIRAQQLSGPPLPTLLAQFDQERSVGVALGVVEKIRL